MKYTVNDIKTKLKENYAAMAKEYVAEVDKSYNKRVAALRPGQPAPERGLTEMEAKAFRARVGEYKRRAEAIIDSAKDQIGADVTAAPSAEAANYIAMLSRRERIDPREINFAVNAYGKNFSCYSVLCELAAKNKIYLANHPTQNALEDIQAFEQLNRYYTLENLSDPKQPPALTSRLYAASIDGTLFSSEGGSGSEM